MNTLELTAAAASCLPAPAPLCPSVCLPQEFDPTCIRDFLQLLTPARTRITWASRTHEQTQTQASPAAAAAAPSDAPPSFVLPPPQLTCEPIYGTQYEVTPLPAPWLQASFFLLQRGLCVDLTSSALVALVPGICCSIVSAPRSCPLEKNSVGSRLPDVASFPDVGAFCSSLLSACHCRPGPMVCPSLGCTCLR